MKHLFPDDFLASVGRLSMNIRAAPPRATHGVHLSPRPGASLEFRDYQPYAPGDDLRRVDWAVYRRTKHLFVRRFDRPTAVPVFAFLDSSASMHLETPSRYDTGARLAAAIASSAVNAHNPLRVVIADGQTTVPQVRTGRRGLVRTLAELAADHPNQGPGLADAIEAILPALAAQNRGVLVIISDFFEPRGVEALVDVLRSTSQRLVLLRLAQPWDADPSIEDDLELQDCETDALLNVSAGTKVLDRYRQAYRSYFATLDAYASVRGATQAIFNASEPLLPQLERLFPGGVLSL